MRSCGHEAVTFSLRKWSCRLARGLGVEADTSSGPELGHLPGLPPGTDGWGTNRGSPGSRPAEVPTETEAH